MEDIFKTLLMERREILKNKGYDISKEYTFEAYIDNGTQRIVVERKYNDISYVNYWIDKDGKAKWKVYMDNGESLYLVDDSKFCQELCPIGVNVINEVIEEEYL